MINKIKKVKRSDLMVQNMKEIMFQEKKTVKGNYYLLMVLNMKVISDKMKLKDMEFIIDLMENVYINIEIFFLFKNA